MRTAIGCTVLSVSVLGSCAGVPKGGGAAGAARVKSAAFLPEIWGRGAAEAHVLYQDGALATPVAEGTLWTFGDTFTGTLDEDGKPKYTGCLSNTMAWLPAKPSRWPPRLKYLSGDDGLAAAPLALASDEDEKKRRLWPLAGVWVHRDGVHNSGAAYMFYGLIDVTGPGPWGFKPVGTGLARAERAFGRYERLRGADGGYGGWPLDPSSIVQRDGWLYLYAPRRFKGESDLTSGLLVGRVRAKDIENQARYEFFAGIEGEGARWSARVEEAVPAAADVWGQASVAWNEYLGSYVLATSSNFLRHDQIQLRRGPMPWGPWTPLEPGAVSGAAVAGGFITVPERPGEQTQLIYCTMLHPELDEDGGRVMTLTFCRMLKRDWAFTNPEGLRIELGRDTAP